MNKQTLKNLLFSFNKSVGNYLPRDVDFYFCSKYDKFVRAYNKVEKWAASAQRSQI